MTHGSLFSGIGGFDLAAEWMGWENIFHCEWNAFGQKVLKYHFPNSISYEDITKTDFTIHRGRIDILTGGFPCQPYSMAGKRLGKEDERHLWPEMLRAIREIQPRWVVGENVLGLVNWSGGLVFHEVQADLEAEGYEVQPYVLPACAVNAPHRRDRVWFVAKNTKRDGFVFGEPNQEGAEIRQFGNACTGDSIGVCATNVAGIASNTNGNPKGTPRQSTSTTGNRSNINVQPSEWGSETELNNRPFAVSRDVTHPNGNGLNQRDGNDEKQPGEGRLDALSNADTSDEYGDVADTNSGGTQSEQNLRQKVSGKKRIDSNGTQSDAANTTNIGRTNALEDGQMERGRFGQSYQRNAWDSFPSVSPICFGDDGISNRLDGITFSKWRNESIKAGGNAIVPQVVYQIFKAIEQYEKG